MSKKMGHNERKNSTFILVFTSFLTILAIFSCYSTDRSVKKEPKNPIFLKKYPSSTWVFYEKKHFYPKNNNKMKGKNINNTTKIPQKTAIDDSAKILTISFLILLSMPALLLSIYFNNYVIFLTYIYLAFKLYFRIE